MTGPAGPAGPPGWRGRAPGLAWLDEQGMTPGLVALFSLAVVLAFGLGLSPASADPVLAAVAGVWAIAVGLVVALVPWGRAPGWTRPLPPLAFCGAVALLRDAAGPVGSALASLLLLPLIYVAVVGTRRDLLLVVLASAAVLVVPVITAAGTTGEVEWRRALLYPTVALIVGLAVQRLVDGMRRSTERLGRLRESSEAIVSAVGDGLVVLDPRGRLVEANEAAAAMLRREPADLVGRTLDEVTGARRALQGSASHPVDTPASGGGGARVGERVITRGDGTELPVRFTRASLRRDGERSGEVIAFRDITERVRVRRLSRARAVVTAALTESSGHEEAAPRIAAGLGEVLDAAVVVLWDLVTSPETGGEPTLEVRAYWEDPDRPHPGFEGATRAMRTPRGLPGEVLDAGRPMWITDLADADPARYPRCRVGLEEGLVALVALPLGSGEPVGVLEVDFRRTESPDDLTRDLLSALAARIGDAARREQVEAASARLKDEFTALVSHELRTPLTSISGYLELLHEEIGDDPVSRRFLQVIGRNTVRLRRLVEDLLFVARVDANRLTLTFGEVDLHDVVHASVEAARPTADAGGLTLSVRVDEPVRVNGDADRLGQVLDNLLSNAIKFTPPGRGVEVVLRTSGTPPMRRAVLEVVDTGMGIAARDLDRLFGRFVRTAEAERANIPGIGLGLVITRAIVDGHEGDISVSSEPGVGTTFRVELPVAASVPTTADSLPPV